MFVLIELGQARGQALGYKEIRREVPPSALREDSSRASAEPETIRESRVGASDRHNTTPVEVALGQSRLPRLSLHSGIGRGVSMKKNRSLSISANVG